ncbi:hypothetical protein HYX17_01860 [Candidatus Woesearchaeota archaeon]|nr:hypothetical protein [Candidatus Woesearchaeota archaeon]
MTLNKYFKKYKVPIIIFSLIAIIFTLPLFQKFENIGIVDWDLWLFYNEAARKSILEYHQIPFWNPYYCGGNILLAHPEFPLFSLQFLFVLIFGTILGIKLSILFFFFLGLISMYILTQYLRFSKLASYASSFIYMLSAPFSIRIGAGQFSYLAMAFYPLAFLFFIKGLKNFKYIPLSVIFLVLAFFSGAIYELSFFILFLTIYAIIKSITERRIKPLIVLIIIILFAFLVASIKLIPLLDFVIDNPRTTEFALGESTKLNEFFDYIFKSTRLSKYYIGGGTPNDPIWWEGDIAIGILGILLVIIGGIFSLKNKKEFAITTIIFILIFLGSTLSISLWKILHFFPPFNSFFVIGRLGMILTFSFALLAGFGFSELQKKLDRSKSIFYLFIFLILLLLSSLFYMNLGIINDSIRIQIPKIDKSDNFYQTIDIIKYDGPLSSNHYLTIKQNKGDLTCFEEIRSLTSVSAIPKEYNDYKGEAYLNEEGKAEITYFSPNRIIIKTESNKENLLILNQNFEKNWKVKSGGVENYNGLLSTKIPKGNSTITFYYLPQSFIIGSIMSLISIILIFIFTKMNNKNAIMIISIILVLSILLYLYISKENIEIPSIYNKLNEDKEYYSIIEIPFTSPLFHAIRYYDVQQNKEVIWHHPSQKISYKIYLLKKIFFADDKNDEKVVSDIIIQDPQKIGISVLNYYNIKKVLLHKKWYGSHLDWKIFSTPPSPYNYSNYKDWYGNELYNITKNFLDKEFIKIYEDDEIIAYDVPKEKEKQHFIIIDKGWYWLELDDKGKKFGWIEDKASIKIMSSKKMSVNLSFDTFNFYEPKTLEIYQNKKFIEDYKIVGNSNINVRLMLNEGENYIEFKTREKCRKPSKVSESEDKRCLSLALMDLGLE